MNDRQSAAEIEDAAIRWLWRLDGHGGAEVEEELESWLSSDTRHRGAFLQAQATWAMLDRGRQLANCPTDNEPETGAFRRRAFIAGAVAVAASLVGVLTMGGGDKIYETSIGEVRQLPLEDGSLAAVNTDTSIEVAFEAGRRTVELHRGEAWFQVAKNPARPFVVAVDDVRVQAIGTAFAVRRHPGGATVLVTEGVVEAWVRGRENSRIRVRAGREAFLSDVSGTTTHLPATSFASRQLEWRSGRIDLEGRTLSEAIEEFNRYNERKLILADRTVADKRLYGIFRTNDAEGFAKAVKATLGVEIAYDDADAIVIGRRRL